MNLKIQSLCHKKKIFHSYLHVKILKSMKYGVIYSIYLVQVVKCKIVKNIL